MYAYAVRHKLWKKLKKWTCLSCYPLKGCYCAFVFFWKNAFTIENEVTYLLLARACSKYPFCEKKVAVRNLPKMSIPKEIPLTQKFQIDRPKTPPWIEEIRLGSTVFLSKTARNRKELLTYFVCVIGKQRPILVCFIRDSSQ